VVSVALSCCEKVPQKAAAATVQNEAEKHVQHKDRGAKTQPRPGNNNNNYNNDKRREKFIRRHAAVGVPVFQSYTARPGSHSSQPI